MTRVKDIIRIIEMKAPLSLALDFDSAGLNSGDENAEVTGILLAQNVTYATLDECEQKKCNLLISHHPSIFGEEIDSYSQSIIRRAKAKDINLYSCHTNLDCCEGGLNDYVAEILGMKEVKIIDGCAREGVIEPITLERFACEVSKKLNDGNVKFVGDGSKIIRKVALCTGAGGRDDELVEYAKANGVDCIIGGESKLSIALKAQDYLLGLIDVGHYDSEIFCKDIFMSWLSGYKDIAYVSDKDVNPYKNIK